MVEQCKEKPWQEFEYKAKRGLETLGYKVSRDVEIAGSQIDLYAELKQPLNIHRIIVECKDLNTKISVKTVRELSALVSAISKPNFNVSGLIVSKNGFSKEAKSFAYAAGIWLMTLNDLFNLSFDANPIIEATIQEFESDELASTYVNLTCSVSEIGSGTIYKPVEKFLDKFFAETKRSGVAVLGNFGTGKTSLCRHYAYLLAKRWHERKNASFALPLYINLRDVQGLDSLDETIHRKAKVAGASLNIFGVRSWLKNGKTLIILDGFDEMASGMDGVTISANFRYLQNFCADNSVNVMLTCRTHFFRKRVEENAFGDLLRLYICDWGKTELVDYVSKARPQTSGAVLEVISKTYNLEELAQTPIFLNMIVNTIKDLGGRINQAKLYQIYTDRWIDNQIHRSRLSPEEKRLFMEELSYIMFRNSISHIPYHELPSHIGTFFSLKDYQTLRSLDQDIRTCTFLIRDDPGRYHFVHRSYMEFFVASHLASLVKENKLDKFSEVKFTKEIAGFFANYFERDVDLLLQLLVRGQIPTIRSNVALSIGQLPFSERLQNALLLALTTENEEDVRFAIIDAILSFGTAIGIRHIVDIAYRVPTCTSYCINALSPFAENDEVLDLIKIALTNLEERKAAIAALSVIDKNRISSLQDDLHIFINKSWWHPDNNIVTEAIRAVDSIGGLRTALKLAALADKKLILKNNQRGDNQEDDNPNRSIFTAACESLTKRFAPEVEKMARVNWTKGYSYPKNEGAIRGQFGNFINDNNLRYLLKTLYEIDKTRIKKNRATRMRASDRRSSERATE